MSLKQCQAFVFLSLEWQYYSPLVMTDKRLWDCIPLWLRLRPLCLSLRFHSESPPLLWHLSPPRQLRKIGPQPHSHLHSPAALHKQTPVPLSESAMGHVWVCLNYVPLYLLLTIFGNQKIIWSLRDVLWRYWILLFTLSNLMSVV